jgi:dynein heavy chain
LKDDYKFSPSGTYYAPAFTDLEGYIVYIRSLPINQMPEAFGLHANANLSSAISEALSLLQTAAALQPKTGSGTGSKSPDELLADSSKHHHSALPVPFDTEVATYKYPVDYNESMNTVLNQELLRFNKLLSKVRSTLSDVGKAVRGLVVMSSELEAVAAGLMMNATPQAWKKVSYPSLKPLASYITDLVARLGFFQNWIDMGTPQTFWISGFFFTQSFLTGQLQNFARKTKVAIDMLTWGYKVQDMTMDSFDAPASGCLVHGLFMDGARWDNIDAVICESLPKVLFSIMPHIHLIPCEATKEKAEKKHVYNAPIYKTSERKGTLSTSGHNTNYILPAQLPMAKQHTEKFWTKRGVALITQLDD